MGRGLSPALENPLCQRNETKTTCYQQLGVSRDRPEVWGSLKSADLDAGTVYKCRDGGAWWASVYGVVHLELPDPTLLLQSHCILGL